MIRHTDFEDPRIVTLNDAAGIRGHLGHEPRSSSDGFCQAYFHQAERPLLREMQSNGIPCAAHILRHLHNADTMQICVRSESRGSLGLLGRHLNKGGGITGIYKDVDDALAQPFLNLAETIRTCWQFAKDSNAPMRKAFIRFAHGEADRGMTRVEYFEIARQMIADLQSFIADLELDLHWLILEPAGTDNEGNGNAWENRKAMQDLADTHDNIHMVGSGYGFELEDKVHYAGPSKILIGELFGQAICDILQAPEASANLTWPRPTSFKIEETSVLINFSEPVSLHKGISDPYCTVDGFSFRQHPDLLKSVEQVDDTSVLVHFDAPLRLKPDDLHYAFLTFSAKRMESEPSRLPIGRGGLARVRAFESRYVEGAMVRTWLPSFSIPMWQTER